MQYKILALKSKSLMYEFVKPLNSIAWLAKNFPYILVSIPVFLKLGHSKNISLDNQVRGICGVFLIYSSINLMAVKGGLTSKNEVNIQNEVSTIIINACFLELVARGAWSKVYVACRLGGESQCDEKYNITKFLAGTAFADLLIMSNVSALIAYSILKLENRIPSEGIFFSIYKNLGIIKTMSFITAHLLMRGCEAYRLSLKEESKKFINETFESMWYQKKIENNVLVSQFLNEYFKSGLLLNIVTSIPAIGAVINNCGTDIKDASGASVCTNNDDLSFVLFCFTCFSLLWLSSAVSRPGVESLKNNVYLPKIKQLLKMKIYPE